MIELGRRAEHGLDRVALLDERGERERLERRARLAAAPAAGGAECVVHLVGLVVAAAHHRHDPTLLVDRDERAGRVGGLVQGLGDRLVGRRLLGLVDGQVDAEALGVGRALAELLVELLPHPLGDVLAADVARTPSAPSCCWCGVARTTTWPSKGIASAAAASAGVMSPVSTMAVEHGPLRRRIASAGLRVGSACLRRADQPGQQRRLVDG